MLGVAVSAIDPRLKKIVNENGQTFQYEKLLLATGARPRVLAISGAALEGTCYIATSMTTLR